MAELLQKLTDEYHNYIKGNCGKGYTKSYLDSVWWYYAVDTPVYKEIVNYQKQQWENLKNSCGPGKMFDYSTMSCKPMPCPEGGVRDIYGNCVYVADGKNDVTKTLRQNQISKMVCPDGYEYDFKQDKCIKKECKRGEQYNPITGSCCYNPVDTTLPKLPAGNKMFGGNCGNGITGLQGLYPKVVDPYFPGNCTPGTITNPELLKPTQLPPITVPGSSATPAFNLNLNPPNKNTSNNNSVTIEELFK